MDKFRQTLHCRRAVWHEKILKAETGRMQSGAHGNLPPILPGYQSRKKRNVPSNPAKVCPPISAGDQGFAH